MAERVIMPAPGEEVECPICMGTGKVWGEDCPLCEGLKTAPKEVAQRAAEGRRAGRGGKAAQAAAL